MEAETRSTFIREAYAYNEYHNLQRFALMKGEQLYRMEYRLELYELPAFGQYSADLDLPQLAVYRTSLSPGQEGMTTLEEMTTPPLSCPEPEQRCTTSDCSMSPIVWKTPLVTPTTDTLEDVLTALLTHDINRLAPIGFLQTSWSYRTATTPGPYVTNDNRRRPVQMSYINDVSMDFYLLTPPSHTIPLLASPFVRSPVTSPILSGYHGFAPERSPDDTLPSIAPLTPRPVYVRAQPVLAQNQTALSLLSLELCLRCCLSR